MLRSQRRPRAFTLVEILVVIAIILITTLIALPLLYGALKGGDATSAAVILQGAIAGARDAAIRENQPRGLRLMPDPLLTVPALGTAGAGTRQLAFNRLMPIEPAADYSMGRINVGVTPIPTATFPPPHPITPGVTYPIPDAFGVVKVLMIEESPLVGGFTSPTGVPNEPTNWWWNVRIGDKLKFHGSGRSYTVVGPCTINPNAPLATNVGNPEMFVNVGAPGTLSPLVRIYLNGAGTPIPNVQNPEFLLVVNGEDDDRDGFADQGWDGYDQNANGVVDDALEWTEVEQWKTANVTGLQDSTYSISRRPVPSPGAREIPLPPGVVIDATTWNTSRERSRLPIQPGALTCDVMVNPNGLYIPTTQYSTPTSMGAAPFLHFWLTSRDDVHPDGDLWGTNATTGIGNPNPSAPTQNFRLPMPEGTAGYPPTGTVTPSPVTLKNDRRLVTLYTQTGMVVTNLIETVSPPANSYLPGEGFNVLDMNQPFYHAQLGRREVR
jgi:prepilin-type N-terminal cleavage/methylation domain-containing protein